MRTRTLYLMGGILLTLSCEAIDGDSPPYTAVFCAPSELATVAGVIAKAMVSGRGVFDLNPTEDGASSAQIPDVPAGAADVRLVFYKGDLPIAESTRTLKLSSAQSVVVRVESCKVQFPDSDGDGISNLDEVLLSGIDAALLGSSSAPSGGKTAWGSKGDCPSSTKDCFSAAFTADGRTRSFTHEMSSIEGYWNESSYLDSKGQVEGKCGYVRADFQTDPDVDSEVYALHFEANLNQETCPSVGNISGPGEVQLQRYVAQVQLFEKLGVGGIDSALAQGRLVVKEMGSVIGGVFSGTFEAKLPRKSVEGSFRFTRRN
ncbi:MAG: hypothetical protein HYT87_18415 [Nitrospirae bacterium]|nr:hypothetical protein [Nitrospirota bacterium]